MSHRNPTQTEQKQHCYSRQIESLANDNLKQSVKHKYTDQTSKIKTRLNSIMDKLDLLNSELMITYKNATDGTGQFSKNVEELQEGAQESRATENEYVFGLFNATNGIKESSNYISEMIKAIDNREFQAGMLDIVIIAIVIEAASTDRHSKEYAALVGEIRRIAKLKEKYAVKD